MDKTDISADNIPMTIEEIERKLEETRVLMNESKFDDAIEQYRICCVKAREIFGDDVHYEMAKFYYIYGNAVLCKIEENGDLFGEDIEKVEKQNEIKEVNENEEDDDENNPKEETNMKENELENNHVIFQNKDTTIVDETDKPEENHSKSLEKNEDLPAATNQESIINSNANINPEIQKSNEQKGEDIEFLQVAWENLEAARVITEKHYEEMKKDPTAKKEDFEKILKQKAKIFLRLGDLECWKENFEEGLSEYKTALEVRRKFEDPNMSRDISEIHFLIGNTHLYLGKEDCEEKALESFNLAKIILENNIRKELGIPFENSNIFSSSQDFDKTMVNPSPFDSEKTKELKSILKMLYEKIEDTVQQKSEKALFALEKEKMKRTANEENTFDQSAATNPKLDSNNKENTAINQIGFSKPVEKIEEKKVVNLGVFGNVRKRPATPIINNTESQATSEEERQLGFEEKKLMKF